MNYRFILILLLVLSINAIHAQTEKRLALVIGNSHYVSGILKNAENDANKVSAKLRELGFTVMSKNNTTFQAMTQEVNNFTDAASNYDVALFFYAGHGIQSNGSNYLIPINDDCIKKEADLKYYSEDVNRLLDRLENSKCKLKIIILDACRNNPLVRSWNRSISSKGLAFINAPNGTLIAYATSPGCVADDGGSLQNSPYTTAFLKTLDKENLDVLNFFNEVGILVNQYTAGKQTPWVSNSPINFVFNKHTTNVITTNSSVLSNNSGKSSITKSNQINDKVNNIINSSTNLIANNLPNQDKKTSDTLGPATIRFICDKPQKASVYLDGVYEGVPPLRVNTTSGTHKIKVVAKGYLTEFSTVELKPDETKLFRLSLTRDIPNWCRFDSYSGGHHLNYHFSPKYELGLSYMYRIDGSRFSFGAMLASSFGLFRGIDWSIVNVSSSVNVSTSLDIKIDDGTGSIVDAVEEISTINSSSDRYSSEIDPFNEAKKYDANFLFLANAGFNVCNGLMLEGGLGAAYYQDRYYMSDTYDIKKTVITNKLTGEVIGEPQYEYNSRGEDKWYEGHTKWSPALRLGARFFIPLDDFDDYSITLGGGYTYLPANHKFSSWDASVGFCWYF